MKGNLNKVIIFVCVLTIWVTPSLAWDEVGHEMTAYIAWQRMSPKARENAIKILRSAPEESQLSSLFQLYGIEPEDVRKRGFFMEAATWADIIRDREVPKRYTFHKGNWHYSDTFWKQVNGQAEVLSEMEKGGQGVKKLYEFDSVLKDPNAKLSEKAIALAWFMHISGDLHQPLHTSARVTDVEPKGDQGGNLFLLSPVGTKREDQLNLHWFWDSIIKRFSPPKNEECGQNYVESMARKAMKKYPFEKMSAGLELGKYSDWQQESFKLNPSIVFSPDLIRNQKPAAKYKKKAFKTAEKQIAIAGYRLGETLNNIFDKQ